MNKTELNMRNTKTRHQGLQTGTVQLKSPRAFIFVHISENLIRWIFWKAKHPRKQKCVTVDIIS